MKIGVIIATQEEFDAFVRKMQEINPGKPDSVRKGGFEILIWKYSMMHSATIIAAHCHFGEISAAANTQLLISEYKVNWIINYGVAGGLVDSISVGDVFVVDRIIHYDLNLGGTDHHYPKGYYPSYGTQYLETSRQLLTKAAAAIPGIQRVTCASGDSFIDENHKRALADETKAQICEMECAGVYLTCRKNNIDCLILKSISDAVDEGAEAFNENVDAASDTCVEALFKIMDYITQ